MLLCFLDDLIYIADLDGAVRGVGCVKGIIFNPHLGSEVAGWKHHFELPFAGVPGSVHHFEPPVHSHLEVGHRERSPTWNSSPGGGGASV